MRWPLLTLAVLASAATAQAQTSLAPRASPVQPFRDFRLQAQPYAGPGRERETTADVSEVLLGYFGTNNPDDPESGDLWKAAVLAVDEANAQGGYHGKPFRFRAAWSAEPWKTGAGLIARMAYRDRVWAVVGGSDGPSAHLAEQVVAKARLPLVCPASSDRSANVANVPWMFSVLPGDHLQAPVLATVLLERCNDRKYGFVSAPDHDSRRFVTELDRELKRRHSAPSFVHVLPPERAGMSATVRTVLAESLTAVVLVAGAETSGLLVRELRTAGFSGLILGTHAMGRRRFAATAGPAADGVLFPLLCNPDALPPSFRLAFETRYHALPDYAAAHTYDAVKLLIAAIRKAGLNRSRIGDALRLVSPYEGVTGVIAWDSLGSNSRRVVLGTIRSGRTVQAEPALSPCSIKGR